MRSGIKHDRGSHPGTGKYATNQSRKQSHCLFSIHQHAWYHSLAAPPQSIFGKYWSRSTRGIRFNSMNWYVHPLFKSVLSNTVKYISFVKWHIFYQLPIHKTNINELRVTYYRMYVCLVWPFVPLSALMPPLSIIAETLPRWRKLWERERVRWRRRAAEWLYLASTLLWRLFADDSVLLRTRKFNSNRLVLPPKDWLVRAMFFFPSLFFRLLLSCIYKYL